MVSLTPCNSLINISQIPNVTLPHVPKKLTICACLQLPSHYHLATHPYYHLTNPQCQITIYQADDINVQPIFTNGHIYGSKVAETLCRCRTIIILASHCHLIISSLCRSQGQTAEITPVYFLFIFIFRPSGFVHRSPPRATAGQILQIRC